MKIVRFRLMLCLIPLFLFGIGLFFMAAPDLALCVPELVGLTALGTVLAVFAVFAEEKGWCRWSPAFVFLMAAVFRMLLLFRNPELSDDLYRYLFDGLMLLDGLNPYAASPLTALSAGPEAAALVPRINHAHLSTIYPPMAQVFFALGAHVGGVFGMKLVLILMDLLACVLIFGILRRLGLPDARVMLYAWHPLPILEIGASGHIDAAAVSLTLLALFVTLGLKAESTGRIRVFLAGACFAGAVLVKWIPLLFFPGLISLIPPVRRWFWVGGAGLTGLILFFPFLPEAASGFDTLGVYLANWEFSGFAFRTLRMITGSGQTSRVILALAGGGILLVLYARMFPGLSCRYPFGLFGGRTDSPPPLWVLGACCAAALTWLMLTPTLHPWYGLYLVAFLPFAPGAAGIVLSWSVILGYRVLMDYRLSGLWLEDSLTSFLIISAPLLALAASCCLSGNRLHKH